MDIVEIDSDFVTSGREAAKEGAKAQADGKPKSANPYEGKDDFLALQWGRAWCRANYLAQL